MGFAPCQLRCDPCTELCHRPLTRQQLCLLERGFLRRLLLLVRESSFSRRMRLTSTRSCARTFWRKVPVDGDVRADGPDQFLRDDTEGFIRRTLSRRCRSFPARRRTRLRPDTFERVAPRVRLAHLFREADQLLDRLRRLDRAVLVAADRLLQSRRRTAPGPHSCGDASPAGLSSFCSSSTARLRCGMPRTSDRNSSERMECQAWPALPPQRCRSPPRALRHAR